MYNPDGWMLVKITSEGKTHYRVFGSWRGGYLDGDSWRLNSGVVRHEEEIVKNSMNEDLKIYRFYGSSGSCYQVVEKTYGLLGPYNEGVLGSYASQSTDKITFEPLQEMPDINSIEWGIE